MKIRKFAMKLAGKLTTKSTTKATTKAKWSAAVAVALTLVVMQARHLRADEDEEGEHEEHRAKSSERTERGDTLGRKLPAVSNAKWKAECSSCHMLYPPGLLPARSWTALMKGLDKHFGENASLDAKTSQEIAKFLVDNSADRSGNRRSSKINSSIPRGETPLRITETPYFIRKHDEISAGVWKRPKIKSQANCIACHRGAEQGNFEEDEVSIPR